MWSLVATTTSDKSRNKKTSTKASAFRVHCALPYDDCRQYSFDFIQPKPVPSSFLLEAFVTIRHLE